MRFYWNFSIKSKPSVNESCVLSHKSSRWNSQENVFNPFVFQHILNNDNSDPDISFFNNKFDVVDSPYFSSEEIPYKVEIFLENLISVFLVSIRSLIKKIEIFLEFLNMKNEFDDIAISETCCNDDSINVKSLYQIPSYIPIYWIGKTGNNCRGLALYVPKTITFNMLEKAIITNTQKFFRWNNSKNQKNMILLCIYRPPRGNQNVFTSNIKYLIERYKQNQKSFVIVGDLNLNSLNYTTNNLAQNLFNLVIENYFSCDPSTHKNYKDQCNCNWPNTYKHYIRCWSSKLNNKEWSKISLGYFLCLEDNFKKKKH